MLILQKEMWAQRRILSHDHAVVSRSFSRVSVSVTQERLETKEKRNMAAGSLELVKIVLLRETIDE